MTHKNIIIIIVSSYSVRDCATSPRLAMVIRLALLAVWSLSLQIGTSFVLAPRQGHRHSSLCRRDAAAVLSPASPVLLMPGDPLPPSTPAAPETWPRFLFLFRASQATGDFRINEARL